MAMCVITHPPLDKNKTLTSHYGFYTDNIFRTLLLFLPFAVLYYFDTPYWGMNNSSLNLDLYICIENYTKFFITFVICLHKDIRYLALLSIAIGRTQ